jgi:hypothetical protein
MRNAEKEHIKKLKYKLEKCQMNVSKILSEHDWPHPSDQSTCLDPIIQLHPVSLKCLRTKVEIFDTVHTYVLFYQWNKSNNITYYVYVGRSREAIDD